MYVDDTYCSNLFYGLVNKGYVRLQVNTIPSNATVSFTGSGIEQRGGKHVWVIAGSSISYSVSAPHYDTITNTTVVNNNLSVYTALKSSSVTLTINPTPSNANVLLEATGYAQRGNSITVDKGTTVSYSVSSGSYETITNSITLDSDQILNVSLDPSLATLTINPTPHDASVTLTSTGATQNNNSITVVKGASVSYTVSAPHYKTVTNTLIVNDDQTLSLNLESTLVTFTINPTPNNATVAITATGYSQSGNSITVDKGTAISYSVSAEGYETEADSITINSDKVISIELERKTAILTINPTPNSATVVLTATGFVQSDNSIEVNVGTSVSYTVSAEGYDTITNSVVINSDQTINVTLDQSLATLTINPIPNNATVVLTASGYTQSGNSITVVKGTSVSYTVSASGYETRTNTVVVNNDQVMSITLDQSLATLSINPTPSNATVVLTASGYTQSGNSITVVKGTSVSYTVSASHYQTVSNTVTVSDDISLDVSLQSTLVTFTINPTPNNATVVLTAAGYTQSGNSITVDKGTTVSYTVSAQHYTTVTNSATVTGNQTLNVSLQSTLVTLTINPTPSNAAVILTSSGYTQSGNSITVDKGTSVSYTVSASGYDTVINSMTVNSSQTLSVSLERSLVTLTINPTPSNATVSLTVDGHTQSGNSISVATGTPVSYTVSAQHYIAITNSIVMNNNQTLNVELQPELVTLTINPTPNNANVTLVAAGYTQVGNSISVGIGTSVSYTVSATGYVTDSDIINVNSTQTVSVTLVKAITYNFVALGSGKIATSTDGETWVDKTVDSGSWNDAIVEDGKFILVGDSGKISTSSDGSTWTTQIVGSDSWNSITYGNSTFVAVNNSGEVTTSSNGTTWTTPVEIAPSLKDIIYDNGTFVTVGNRVIATSSDGATWNVNDSLRGTFTSIAYGNNMWVTTNATGNSIVTSTDLENWSIDSSTTGGIVVFSVCYGNGLFVIGAMNKIFVSSNGSTWTASSLSSIWDSTTYGNNLFVLWSRTDSAIATSSDGSNWTTQTLTDSWNKITFCKEL